jgi:hypothetical protein
MGSGTLEIFVPLPPSPLPLVSLLYNKLAGCTPIDKQTKDTRSWGTSEYSVKQGYKQLIAEM